MSKAKAGLPPEVLDSERVKHVFAGSIQSRTDPERVYGARFLMQVDAFCACPDSSIKKHLCDHLKALLREIPCSDMRQWVLDSTTVGSETPSEE